MRKILALAVLLLCNTVLLAQKRTITGKITDQNGQGVPAASVLIKGTSTGTAALNDGTFSISAQTGDVLTISAVNFVTQDVPVSEQSTLSIVLQPSSGNLTEVVVTALGIKRNKNQLPYAAQQVAGEELNRTRNNNVGANLSGKISGLEIRQANTLGGSTNIVIRGAKSLTQSNQALFVIDGVPYDNSNTNVQNQRNGRGGYDYGNAAADINPDDIESVTVLKGAASTALYGSRGANGVIVITTKKGRKGLGITINSSYGIGKIDKETFASYQKRYGGGYGQYYEDESGYLLYRDPSQGYTYTGAPGSVLVAVLGDDASYGHAFDPNLTVYQWDAFGDPTSPNYNKGRPWVAAANDPTTFFETANSINNSVFIDGGGDKGSFKLGYTRSKDEGILPNSRLTKDLVNFSSSYNITKNFTASAAVNYSKIKGLGRYGTGYDSKNPMTNFRQWWQVNVDLEEQKAAYFRTKQNMTWNWADPANITPIFWDNVYWDRYENYENDSRSRYQGNITLNYKVTDWLNVLGRVSIDRYDEIQEERIAIGSIAASLLGQVYGGDPEPSGYGRFNRTFQETNYDLMINFDKNIAENFNLKALLGGNIRQTDNSSITAKTNGGLIIPRLYSLTNSVNPIVAPAELVTQVQVNGVFAGATLSYKNFLTLDGTVRRDQSSTLPEDNNTYYYPMVAGGFVFSNLLKLPWLSYGKLRGNYAEVGNSAPALSTYDVYSINPPFGSVPMSSVGTPTSVTKNNENLKPEKTKSWEVGLEASFFKNRAGFDITYYHAETVNQILPVSVSRVTGYNFKFVNAGTIENKGVELSVYGTPIKGKNFSWQINLNWTRNRNKVKELYGEVDNLILGSFQGGVTINATLGQPYGTIRGTTYIYDSVTGQKLINSLGRYVTTQSSNNVIGNQNPDWIGGIQNTLKYKDLALTFLVDIRQGGDVFSLDMYYGLATGLYPETAGLNDLGNPLRNLLDDGGGIIRQGVTEDHKPNTIRDAASNFGAYGYRRDCAAGFVYDASYVKLREVALTYSLPAKLIDKMAPFRGIDISLIGRNLWIIHKNLPYADPEETMSSGNAQGYQGGAYPTVRNYGVNLRLKF